MSKAEFKNMLHDITLVGMKFDHSIPYFDSLPDSFVLCSDFRDFFKLKKNKRVRSKENLESIVGMEYLVFSPTSKKYYYKVIYEQTNMRTLLDYFKDHNLYMYKKEIQNEKLKTLCPELETESTDYVLF